MKRSLLATLGTAACLALTAMQAAPAHADTGPYPIGTFGTAINAFFTSPDAVAGANNWDCKPSAAHPHPVVLVHGTSANLGENWVALSPMLANAGYCVFALNYGETGISLGGRIDGLGGVAASAGELSAFVDKVLAATGASQVDIVGHSQGGMMPNYYIKRLGGASKVHTLVGIAPSNHGTNLDGLVNLGQALHLLGLVNGFFSLIGTPAAADQEAGSPFETALFGDGDTVEGPRYVVIETTHDTVVTPYANAFLNGSNVTNITLQNQCPSDPVGHVGLFLDGPTLQDVMNALGPADPTFKPQCTGYGIPF